MQGGQKHGLRLEWQRKFMLNKRHTTSHLYDYSLKYYAGELHLWENAESTKIDDDVIFLVPSFSNGERIQKMIIGTNNDSVPAAEATAASPW